MPLESWSAHRGDEDDDRSSSGVGLTGILVFFNLLLIPSWIVGVAFFQLLRKVRLRPSVITAIMASCVLVMATVWYFADFTSQVSQYFSSLDAFMAIFSSFGAFVSDILGPLFAIYGGLGVVGGWLYCLWEARGLQTRPELKTVSGYWTYKFTYRKTPREVFAKRRKVNDLRRGEYRSDTESPLGLDESDDAIVQRHIDESLLHTIITGGTGSGKAVRGDTLIPLYQGGFIEAKDVSVGDVLIDENSQPAEVLEVFSPKNTDEFEVRFSDGTSVYTCGEHLWDIADARGARGILSTAQMAEKMRAWDYTISSEIFFVETVAQPLPYDNQGRSIEQRHESVISFLKDFPAKFSGGCVSVDVDEWSRKDCIRLISSMGWVAYRDRGLISFYPSGDDFVQHMGNSDIGSDWVDNIVPYLPYNEIRNKWRGITSITQVQRPSDQQFFCFTVDSPRSLFLVSESCIPTHNTISMLSLIKSDIAAGRPVFVLDMKRSPDLASKLAKWSAEYRQEHGSEFYHFVNGDPENYDIPDSEGQAFYDPLKAGSPTSKADMVLGMREYDQASAVYKSAMQNLLSVLFNTVEQVRKIRETTGRMDICESIDWDNGGVYLLNSVAKTDNFIELLTAAMNHSSDPKTVSMAQDVLANLSKRSSMLSHAMGELQGQMQTILSSEYGKWLKTAPQERSIDLFDASTKRGSVVLFSLNSDDEKEFARFIGSIIMSDITRVSAQRRNRDITNHIGIYIDEFQILVPDNVMDLLEKARASAMGITLAQQSLSQVIKGAAANGDSYLQSILDTCSNFIFHAGAGFETAKKMSEIVGQEDVEVYSTTRRDNRSIFAINWFNKRNLLVNTTVSKEWIVDPSRFMQLSIPASSNGYKSTAMVIKKSSSALNSRSGDRGAVVNETWMIPEAEILEKTYEPGNSQARHIYDERHEEIEGDEAFGVSLSAHSLASEVRAEEIENRVSEKIGKTTRGPGRPKGQEQDVHTVGGAFSSAPAPSGSTPQAPATGQGVRGGDQGHNLGSTREQPPAHERDRSDSPRRPGNDSYDDWSLEDLMSDDDDVDTGFQPVDGEERARREPASTRSAPPRPARTGSPQQASSRPKTSTGPLPSAPVSSGREPGRGRFSDRSGGLPVIREK